jgi:hypothetical protein
MSCGLQFACTVNHDIGGPYDCLWSVCDILQPSILSVCTVHMCVHNQGVNRTEMPGMPGRDVTMLAPTTAGGYKREQLKSSFF